jgi:ABC-type Na+ efflux pump permease subunit
MPADKNPVFRKAVIPWYNSTTAHIIVVLFMLVVVLFAAAGLAVARENPDYQGYIWVPALLLAMSVAIIATAVIRLIKRTSQKPIR